MCVTSDTIWYHGSPCEIDTLLPGSTVTPPPNQQLSPMTTGALYSRLVSAPVFSL